MLVNTGRRRKHRLLSAKPTNIQDPTSNIRLLNIQHPAFDYRTFESNR